MKRYEWILFDIGGVLVKLGGFLKLLDWMNEKMDREELGSLWLHSDAVRAYETGKINSTEFAANIVKELELTITSDEFLEEFFFFINGFYDGVEELLQKLSEKYSVATLSNINEIHWNRLCRENHFDDLIKTNFLSFQTGYMKPDQEAFLKVIDGLGCKAEQIIFFDDSKTNVEAARKMGMSAIQVNGIEDVKRQLELNVL